MSFMSLLMITVLAQQGPKLGVNPQPTCPKGESYAVGRGCLPSVDAAAEALKPSAPVTQRADMVIILGSMAKADVDRTLQPTVAPIELCYSARLAEKPDLEGLLALRVEVLPDGSVKSVVTNEKRSTALDPVVEQCAHEAVKALRFPAIEGGGQLVIVGPVWELHPPTTSKTPKAPAP